MKRTFKDANSKILTTPDSTGTIGCAIPMELNPAYNKFYARVNKGGSSSALDTAGCAYEAKQPAI